MIFLKLRETDLMNVRAKKLFPLPALIVALGLLPTGGVSAQSFANLHNFTLPSGLPSFTNTDGILPSANLILGGTTLYGTAVLGGAAGKGAVFAVNTDGSGFTNLHNFIISDGANPEAGLLLAGNTLYGTTRLGGPSGNGTVFAVRTNGTGFTNLYLFTGGNDGAYPESGLVLAGGVLYGTAVNGGSAGNGTVFCLSTNGTSFTNLHSFTATGGTGTNGDGALPFAGLALGGNTLYGTTANGGSAGNGTVFALSANGANFTNLHSFTALTAGTNEDGTVSHAAPLLVGNTLYGTTASGGSAGNGTVFSLSTSGAGFTNLHNFTALSGGINSDGANPEVGLILSGGTLYGVAGNGGAGGRGVVFCLGTSGAGFTNLHGFSALAGGNTNTDGAFPRGALVAAGGALYGTAYQGGYSANGTVFGLMESGFTVSGAVELQAFGGSSRQVRFGMSAVVGGVTNYLQTNDVVLNFAGGVAGYNLPVPPNTTHISVKTAWNLRRRQAVAFVNGAATVSFTGANRLNAGDLANGGVGIDFTDNVVSSSDYLLMLGYYLQPVNGDPNVARADVDGDGAVGSSDYLLLLGNYLQMGDSL